MTPSDASPIRVLLVENNPGDVRITIESMREARVINNLTVVSDGEEALEFLRREGPYMNASRPDLILLDLTLPRKDGRAVLAELKADTSLRRIPVAVLISPKTDEDLRSLNVPSNRWITKPVDPDQLINVLQSIGDFWFSVVRLPYFEDAPLGSADVTPAVQAFIW